MLFSVSDENGGRRASGQKLGRLVTTPLTDFSRLTRKDAVLDCHEKNDYHVMNKVRAMELMKHGQSDRNITSLINVHHQEKILQIGLLCFQPLKRLSSLLTKIFRCGDIEIVGVRGLTLQENA